MTHMAFLALITSMVAVLLTLVNGCTKRIVPNTDGVATLTECVRKGMQLDANKRKCILPDDAFCYSQLMIKGMSVCIQPSSQSDCDKIARNNSSVSSLKYRNSSCTKVGAGNEPSGNRDTSIGIKITSRISGAIPKQPNGVILADAQIAPANNQDMHQFTVMNYPTSGCTVRSNRDPHGTAKFIITAVPSATATNCNAKIVVINLITGAYNTADIVAKVAP